MATSQLLQSLNDAANQMGNTISKRDAVAFDMSQTADSDKTLFVVRTDTDAQETKCFVGVALESATSGNPVRVCIGGICDLNCTASAAGVTLMISNTGGRAIDFAPPTVLQRIAVSCEAHSGNRATVIVLKQF
jgi:hypothetical protein